MEGLLTIIMFLGEQCLAFRGSSDVLFQQNNGNFLKTVEFLAKFDNIMAEHLRKITNSETHVHYLSHEIQNELINLLAKSIHCHNIRYIEISQILLNYCGLYTGY